MNEKEIFFTKSIKNELLRRRKVALNDLTEPHNPVCYLAVRAVSLRSVLT